MTFNWKNKTAKQNNLFSIILVYLDLNDFIKFVCFFLIIIIIFLCFFSISEITKGLQKAEIWWICVITINKKRNKQKKTENTLKRNFRKPITKYQDVRTKETTKINMQHDVYPIKVM